MSPVQIRTLLYAYYVAEPFVDPSLAEVAAINFLVRNGMIEARKDDERKEEASLPGHVVPRLPTYRTTEKGNCFVDHICKLPLPTWVLLTAVLPTVVPK